VLNRAATTVDLADPATRERLFMLDSGLRMVGDHPALGLGPGLVQRTYAAYRSDEAPPRIPHLHNNAVQIAAERGIAGLLAYLAVLAVFAHHIWRAMQTASPDARPALMGCAMAVAGVTAAGFFEYNWGDAEVWIVTLVSLSAPFALIPRSTV
jgi:putative inorganic carbon (HCO3(-)) transporter